MSEPRPTQNHARPLHHRWPINSRRRRTHLPRIAHVRGPRARRRSGRECARHSECCLPHGDLHRGADRRSPRPPACFDHRKCRLHHRIRHSGDRYQRARRRDRPRPLQRDGHLPANPGTRAIAANSARRQGSRFCVHDVRNGLPPCVPRVPGRHSSLARGDELAVDSGDLGHRWRAHRRHRHLRARPKCDASTHR